MFKPTPPNWKKCWLTVSIKGSFQLESNRDSGKHPQLCSSQAVLDLPRCHSGVDGTHNDPSIYMGEFVKTGPCTQQSSSWFPRHCLIAWQCLYADAVLGDGPSNYLACRYRLFIIKYTAVPLGIRTEETILAKYGGLDHISHKPRRMRVCCRSLMGNTSVHVSSRQDAEWRALLIYAY